MTKILLLLMFIIGSTHAALPGLEDLSSSEIEGVSDDFASNFMPTTVSPASSLGKIFGIEAGLIGGIADAGNIADMTDANSDFTKIPHAGILLRGHVPFGLGASLVMLPIDLGDFKYNYYSFGVKWTLTDIWGTLPFDFAVNAFFTTAEFSYDDSVTNGNINVKYKNKSTTLDFTLSKKLAILEPYFGIGYIMGSSDFTITGTSAAVDDFFGPGLTASAGTNIDSDSFYYKAGLQLNLLVMNIAAEYASAFGNSRLTAKIALKF